MKQMLNLFQDILDNGVNVMDRTGTGRRRVFGRQLRFDLSKGEFPLMTSRKMFTRGMIEELLWIIRGSLNASELTNKKVHIWDAWKVEESHIAEFAKKKIVEDEDEQQEYISYATHTQLGSIGRLYGPSLRTAPASEDIYLLSSNFSFDKLASDKQALAKRLHSDPKYMAQFQMSEAVSVEDLALHLFGKTVDQLQNVMLSLKERPYSSRHVMTSWIPEWIADETVSPQENVLNGRGALAPCHGVTIQLFVNPPTVEGGKKLLSLNMYQRSCDTVIGGCLNVPSYSLLLMMIAQCLDMQAHEFIWSLGDAHLYLDHLETVKEQLKREPRPLPQMLINPNIKDIFQFKVEDFELIDYNPHPSMNYNKSV